MNSLREPSATLNRHKSSQQELSLSNAYSNLPNSVGCGENRTFIGATAWATAAMNLLDLLFVGVSTTCYVSARRLLSKFPCCLK